MAEIANELAQPLGVGSQRFVHDLDVGAGRLIPRKISSPNGTAALPTAGRSMLRVIRPTLPRND